MYIGHSLHSSIFSQPQFLILTTPVPALRRDRIMRFRSVQSITRGRDLVTGTRALRHLAVAFWSIAQPRWICGSVFGDELVSTPPGDRNSDVLVYRARGAR